MSLTQQCTKIKELQDSLSANVQKKDDLETELRGIKVAKSELVRDLEDENNRTMHLKVEMEEEETLLKADLEDYLRRA